MLAPQFDVSADFLREQGLSPTFPERFWKRVFITPTHWLWDGLRRMPAGHGTIWKGTINERGEYRGLIYAHRASWLFHYGTIEPGLFVLHRCPGRHVPWCVNPEHLYLGTALDNTRDMQQQWANGFAVRTNNGANRGEHQAQHKLTWVEVEEIRARYTGAMGEQNALAVEFGVSQGTIWKILANHAWRTANGPAKGLAERHERIETEHRRVKRPFPMQGEDVPAHKLTKAQVDEIRAKYTGAFGQQSALAHEYGVRQGTIWYIVNHKTW